MTAIDASGRRLAALLEAHQSPDLELQESDRALQRMVVTLAIGGVWLAQMLAGRTVHASAWFIVLIVLVVPAGTFAYRRYALGRNRQSALFVYLFLVLDPILLVGLLVQDPETFAYLNPFLLVTIVRSGIRYGIRTFYLAWLATLAASALLATSAFWRREVDLTFSFLLMLLCVPVFFSSLIRRIHNVRAIEQQRAQFAALNDIVVARSAFLAKVSHELRSPLQGIVSALDVLAMRRGPQVDADNELISRIRRS